MAIQNDILSSTARARSKKAVDNLFKTIPLLDHIKSAGGVEIINGGQRITRAGVFGDHSAITQLSTGYEAVNSSTIGVTSLLQLLSLVKKNYLTKARTLLFLSLTLV